MVGVIKRASLDLELSRNHERKQSQMTIAKSRKIHRVLVPFAAAPLLLTTITGSVFGALESRGIKAEWLLDLHKGRFGPLNLTPYYSVLLGISTIVVAVSGMIMLAPKKKA